MLKRHLQVSFPVLVFVCGVVASPFSFAQCGCSDDGHGAPLLGGNSLGQSFPPAGLIAQDTAWQVYEFQRDGVRYLQINDRVGSQGTAVKPAAPRSPAVPVAQKAEMWVGSLAEPTKVDRIYNGSVVWRLENVGGPGEPDTCSGGAGTDTLPTGHGCEVRNTIP